MAANETASITTPDSQTLQEQQTRNATRGGLVVLLAKMVFIVGGLAQKILLPHVIGMSGFGAFGRMSALPNVLNNVAVSATIMGVSKAVASSPEPDATQRQVLRIHAAIAVLLGAVLFAGAPWVAAFQRAPEMTLGLRVMSAVLAAYGLYAACIGVLNGTQRFAVQARFDMAYTVLRTALMLGGAWLSMRMSARGEVGAAAGIVAASSLILLLSYARIGRGSEGRTALSDGAYVRALLPVAGVQLIANLLMQADMLWLGRVLTPVNPSTLEVTEVNLWCGYYQAATVFAFLPYQLSIAVTQVLLPGVAKAFVARDTEATRLQVQRGARWGLLLVGLLAGTIVFLHGNAVSFLFGAEAGRHTAHVVRWLCVAQGLFAMMALGQTVLVAVDRRRDALFVSLITLVVVAVGFGAIVASAQAKDLVLVTLSERMALAMAVGAIASAVMVLRVVPKSLPRFTLVRVVVWICAALGAGAALGTMGKLQTLLTAAGAVMAYAAYLMVSGELSAAELRGIAKLVLRR